MDLVRRVAQVDAEEVVEGESETLAFAERGQERDGERTNK